MDPTDPDSVPDPDPQHWHKLPFLQKFIPISGYLSFIVPNAGKELASGGQRAESKIRKASPIPAETVSVLEITVGREHGGNSQFVEHDDAVSGEFKEGQTFEDAAAAGRASVDNIPVHPGVSLRSTAHLLITPSDCSPAVPQPVPSKRSVVCGSAAVVAGPSGAAQAIPVPAEIIQILETGMATLPPLSEGNSSSDPNLSEVKKKKICDSHVPYNTQEQNSMFVSQDHIKEGVGGSCLRKGLQCFFPPSFLIRVIFLPSLIRTFRTYKLYFQEGKVVLKG
jgi:hypothetical protein